MMFKIVSFLCVLLFSAVATETIKSGGFIAFPYSSSFEEYLGNFVPNFLGVFRQSLRHVDYSHTPVIGDIILATVDNPNLVVERVGTVANTVHEHGEHLAKYFFDQIYESTRTSSAIIKLYKSLISVNATFSTNAVKVCGSCGDQEYISRCIETVQIQFAKDSAREITTNEKILKYFSSDVTLFGYSMFQLEVVSYLNIVENFLIGKVQLDVADLYDDLYAQYLDNPTFDNFNDKLLPLFLKKLIVIMEDADVLDMFSKLIKSTENRKIIPMIQEMVIIMHKNAANVLNYQYC